MWRIPRQSGHTHRVFEGVQEELLQTIGHDLSPGLQAADIPRKFGFRDGPGLIVGRERFSNQALWLNITNSRCSSIGQAQVIFPNLLDEQLSRYDKSDRPHFRLHCYILQTGQRVLVELYDTVLHLGQEAILRWYPSGEPSASRILADESSQASRPWP